MNNDGMLTGHSHVKGHLFKLRLVDNPECDRCKQASETISYTKVCDCKTLATHRFRHLGQHSIQPGDFEDISVRRLLHFLAGVGLLCMNVRVAQKINTGSVHGSLQCPPFFILFYSILFYSILFYSILFYSILFYSLFIGWMK